MNDEMSRATSPEASVMVRASSQKEDGIKKFDEYTFFAESTQQMSERRQAATQTYLTANTIVAAALGFLIKDMGFPGWGMVLVSLPFFLVGVLACIIWHRIIIQYKALASWRYKQLIEMEQAMLGSHRMYLKEWEDVYKPQAGKKFISFSQLELWLPRLFLGMYVAYGVGLVVVTALGWL